MVENVLNEMKRLLDHHLPAELARQDGQFGDGITLDQVNTILVGGATPNSYGLPAVVLSPREMQATQWATGKKDVEYEIDIAVAVTDTDEDVSQKRLWRTMRAIENVFEIFGPGSGPIINYVTTGANFEASLFDMDENKSTEKGGILSARVMERLGAYVSTQI